MPQHFLLSARARSLSLAKVLRMTDEQAERAFMSVRFADNGGDAFCPHCGCVTVYEARRPSGTLRWRCKACRKDFSITSGTLFAFHKMPLRSYLAAIVIFCNEVKGKSALALSRDLDCQYKTAWVLAHKLREAMASDMKGGTVGGPGKMAEIDGGYFGGYVKPANHKTNRKDRRRHANQNGKRQCVVVIRERGGRIIPGAFPSEAAALTFIRNHVLPGTTLQADESTSWNDLHGRYSMIRINHQEAYSMDGACTNAAESFFSRLRRAEVGHHHHIAGAYLARYAQESAWREDARRERNGDQVMRVAALASRCKSSVDFCGYWQRSQVV